MKQLRDTVGALNTLYADAKEQMDEEVLQQLEHSHEFIAKWNSDLEEIFGE
jgi:hypothetical protein